MISNGGMFEIPAFPPCGHNHIYSRGAKMMIVFHKLSRVDSGAYMGRTSTQVLYREEWTWDWEHV